MAPKKSIFRSQSLDRLSSPDRLDELLRVVRPKNWAMLMGAAGGLLAALLWSIVGRIPENASGPAVLVRPKQVVAFQSPTSGQVAAFEVAVGDSVRKGDLLARMHLPTVQNDLELERLRLMQYQDSTRELSGLERDLAKLERVQIQEQRALIGERIEQLEDSTRRYQESTAEYLQEQRNNLAKSRELSGQLHESFVSKLESVNTLRADGIVSDEPVLSAQSQVVQSEMGLASLDVQAQELTLQENSARENADKNRDTIKGLRIELSGLAMREGEINRRLRQGELGNERNLEEIRSKVEHLSTILLNEGNVFSPYDGRILEIAASEGDLMARGQRLGRLEIEDPDEELMVLAYFDIASGKKIEVAQHIRISPSNVQRERFGGMIGEVLEVTAYPISPEAAGNQIGDVTLARELLGGTSRIGVLAKLVTDSTPSGFAWTSGHGPEAAITAGTTAQARVTTADRAPITFVLPFLRKWTGV